MKPLKGRIIAELVKQDRVERESGLVLINRKAITTKAVVLAIGDPTEDKNGKPMLSPVKIGETIHFRKYTTKIHSGAKDGLKKGKVTLWFTDVILTETSTGLQPSFSNVLVKVVYEQVSDLIYIPESAKKQSMSFFGEVLGVGPDYPYDLKIGDKAIFQRDEGYPVMVGETELFVLKEERVLGVIE